MKLASIADDYISSIRTKKLIELKKTISLVRKELLKGESRFMCNAVHSLHYTTNQIDWSQYVIFKHLIERALESKHTASLEKYVYTTFDSIYRNLNSDVSSYGQTELLAFRLAWLDKLTRYINTQLKLRNI